MEENDPVGKDTPEEMVEKVLVRVILQQRKVEPQVER